MKILKKVFNIICFCIMIFIIAGDIIETNIKDQKTFIMKIRFFLKT